MTAFTDADLYRRGTATMLAAWDEYARGATGAVVLRLPGVVAAVFPNEPERAFYNNALVERDLPATRRVGELDALEAAYAAAGVARFAVWAHESDGALRHDLVQRGYTLEESTLAMGMPLGGPPLPEPEVDLGCDNWSEYLRIIGVPADYLSRSDHAAFHLRIGRADGENVAAAMAFDHDGDTGIYNLGTLEHARRRGLGTALTTLLARDALARGSETASLQSTPVAEHIYATVGFRPLGRILEYVPAKPHR